MANNYRLILQSGLEMGTEYPLEKPELFLGRDLNNDLVINDAEVSRRHARLVLEGATYRIEDLGSTNGTFIRGQRILAPYLLTPSEVITFGEKVVLRFEVTSSDPNATVVAQRTPVQTAQPAVTPFVPPPAPPMAVTPPIAPASAQAYKPIQAAPAYQPIAATPPIQPAPPKKKSKAVLILLIVLGIILLFCVIPWIIIDATSSYCSLFPGILNMLFTGACP